MELLPCSWELVPQILELIKRKNWPGSVTSYNKLDGHATLWKQFGQPPNVSVVTPNGQLDDDATFVLIIPTHRYELHIHSLHTDLEVVAEALLTCPHIDWTQSPTISCMRDTYYPLLDILERNLTSHVRRDCYTRSFHIERGLALKLDLKLADDVRVGSMTVEHAELMNEAWPHGEGAETLQIVKDYVTLRPSVGVFHKDELVAWCLYGEYGGPALLQVAAEHKRKGYGEIALIAMTKISAEMGVNPHAFITPHNHASMGLFTKLGYTEKYPATWTEYFYQPSRIAENFQK